MPSFLKALFISSDETIFDGDETMIGNNYSNLGLKSLTNSAEGAFSAPEAMKIKMQEISRSKSALASSHPGATQETPQTHAYKIMSNAAPALLSAGKLSGHPGSIKTSRDRTPSNILHFGLQGSEQKIPRDRSAQAA